MKKTFKTLKDGNKTFNFLALPSSNYFKMEIVNHMGSNIERVYEQMSGKKVYGISHLIEHLCFKSSKDFTTKQMIDIGKNMGSNNAGTTYDYIEYFFETISEKHELAIQYVFNLAYNDLTKISQKEFESEKSVVYNEAKRYADDEQTMFYYKSAAVATGYHQEDDVIGIPETIATFTLEDAIAVKNLFLQNPDITYNISYDPLVLSQEEIMKAISKEMRRFEIPLSENFTLISKKYTDMLKHPEQEKFIVESEAEQAMNMFIIPLQTDLITADFTSKYLEVFANKTSLNDIIREKHGLTYGIDSYIDTFAHKPYLYITCDVSKEDQNKFMRLFNESINKSVDNFNETLYSQFIEAVRLKRILSHINLQRYESFFMFEKIDPNCLAPYRELLEKDLDEVYKMMYKTISFEVMQKNLKMLKDTINSNQYARLSNV